MKSRSLALATNVKRAIVPDGWFQGQIGRTEYLIGLFTLAVVFAVMLPAVFDAALPADQSLMNMSSNWQTAFLTLQLPGIMLLANLQFRRMQNIGLPGSLALVKLGLSGLLPGSANFIGGDYTEVLKALAWTLVAVDFALLILPPLRSRTPSRNDGKMRNIKP